MIFLVLPYNYNSGWGICSANLAKELSKNHSIKYVSDELKEPNTIEDFYFISRQFKDLEYLKKQKEYPLIQAVQHDLTPYIDYFSGSMRICLTFADRTIPKENIEKAKNNFDFIISGSNWCKNLLKENNVDSIVIHQGINTSLFSKKRKQLFLNDFIVFSGGKFEHRKGQDLTLKAYKVLQDKYADVKLVCAWHNIYTKDSGKQALIDSGIDLTRVIFLPKLLNCQMPQIYENTDIGIFPSRCEAGTNLVLMEYMACGRPVIATIGTGQGDLVNENNGLIIKSKGLCALYEENKIVSYWEEPDLDSIIDNLEYSYKNRKKIQSLGNNGAKLLKNYTWEKMADKLLEIGISSPITAII